MNVPASFLPRWAPRTSLRGEFLSSHLLYPLVALLLLCTVLMAGDGDQWLADQLFRLEGGHWALQDAWLTSHAIHRGGKLLSVGGAVLALLALIAACCRRQWQHWRRPLLYLLSAVALSTGLVSLLKNLTHMDCPWDLSRYGGLRPFIGLFDARPADMATAACFPGGHASAGYAWIALYFVALALKPAWRGYALALPLLLGSVFGIGQQLRGAHFLSHDLASLGISWLVALALYLWMFRTSPSATPAARIPTLGETA